MKDDYELIISHAETMIEGWGEGWNGRGIFIKLQSPDENSKMTSPYIFIDTTGLKTENKAAPKSLSPWLASQTDMLSEDWNSDRVY